MRKPKRNLIYLRASTSQQEPLLQLRDIQSLNPPSNSEILKERRSAWRENVKRPSFEKLLSLVKAGKVKRIYVWHVDRLYRNQKKLIDFLRLCQSKKVRLFSFNQQWLQAVSKIPSPLDEIMILLTGWSAENESRQKSRRIKMSVVRNKKGTYSYRNKRWGRKPFGMKVIRRVKALRKNGLSIRKIASNIRVTYKKNSKRNISKSAVHSILKKK